MDSLTRELDRARDLDISDLADSIQQIGFDCTHCGACCREEDGDPHTATTFPGEVKEIRDMTGESWRNVVRPMPYGLDGDGQGETFEWALQTTSCGDCRFYNENGSDRGGCTIYDSRPLICQTYPFRVDFTGTSKPMGESVDRVGAVVAHECEGLGADIDRRDAIDLAIRLKRRAVREIEELIETRNSVMTANQSDESTVVYDSEGAKRIDGSSI